MTAPSPTPPPGGLGLLRPLVRPVLRHPTLWPVALAQALRLAEPGWWRRRRLPSPSPRLWAFRMETAYGGGGDAVPAAGDVVTYLQWCRDMRRWRRA